MHPTDGELLAILDEWTDPTGQPQLERHVKSCDLCRERQAALERDRQAVGALLGALESPAPARAVESIVQRAERRRRKRRQLVAAVAALFVATAAAATIRAGGVHEIFGRLTAVRAPVAAPAPGTAQAADQAPTGVALEPVSEVKIEFAAAQAEGEVRIAPGESRKVTVTASEPVPYTVQSGAVRLENTGSRASYRIILPRDLARATILVAGRVVFSKKASGIVTEAPRVGDGFRIPLTAPGPTP